MKRGLFISVEGTDGSGKTTQIARMKEYLEGLGYRVLLTREPGGTGIGEKIRSILLDRGNAEMSSTTEMLLYASARAQLMAEVIKPALEDGIMVIADRFVDSSLVYQGFGRGLGVTKVMEVNRIAIGGILPDLTLFFDIDPEAALVRREAATGKDRIEMERMDFHWRVYKGYQELLRIYPDRIISVAANRSVEEIAKDVTDLLNCRIGGV